MKSKIVNLSSVIAAGCRFLLPCAMSCICGKAMSQVIADVHSHNVLPSYIAFVGSHGALLEEGFPIPSWSAERHIEMMDREGIAWSVLTMPAPQPFFGDAAESRAIVRRYNEETAAVKSTYPDRFKFCATLPLPDVKGAIAEAVYALDTLHADGVKLATNSRGMYLGDAALDPLMKVLDERHAVVIIHPHKPTPFNDSLMMQTPLAAYEYPAETTRAVVNMISRNVPSRYPHIRFVVPHCGSFVPLAVPRMKNIVEVMRRSGIDKNIDWKGNMGNLYYDLAGGASADVLRMLLTVTSPSHLLFGSDYPYVSADGVHGVIAGLKSTLAAMPELSHLSDSVFAGNAARLFEKGK
ncbi:MAG: amidohydrolase family protein [Prevotellaceae bacterium]|nr:amidohydrolase family protein [Prevotellaceae bacterium]